MTEQPQIRRPKVLVTIMNQKWVHKHCIFSLVRMLKDPRVDVSYTLPTAVPYVNNLNQTVKYVLDNDYDFWITFDDDNPNANSLNFPSVSCRFDAKPESTIICDLFV